jgi:hypothetical protein
MLFKRMSYFPNNGQESQAVLLSRCMTQYTQTTKEIANYVGRCFKKYTAALMTWLETFHFFLVLFPNLLIVSADASGNC